MSLDSFFSFFLHTDVRINYPLDYFLKKIYLYIIASRNYSKNEWIPYSSLPPGWSYYHTKVESCVATLVEYFIMQF